MNRIRPTGILHVIGSVFTFNIFIGIIVFILLKGAHVVPGVAVVSAQDVTPDISEGVRFDSYPHPNSRGALAYSLPDRWNTTDLTYFIVNCPSSISCNTAHQAIRQSFQSWAEFTPLTFTEVSDERAADILLGWSNRGPELGYIGDVLAYATFPSDGGDVTFDDSEPWSAFDGGEFDLELVATHEIGHALGLDHSDDPQSLMYPVLTPYTTGINQTDIDAIQSLYGFPDRDDQPNQNLPEAADEQVGGQITDAAPYEMWEFEAFAGETLTITLTTTSGDLIPYVGLLTYDEETVLAEDQASGGEKVAQITYTFQGDGTYVIVATRAGVTDGNTEGDYVLSIQTAEADAAPTSPTAGEVLVDVRSYTPVDICEVYISPVEDTNWGENLLSSPLSNGNGVELYFSPGEYDVQVIGCDGSTHVENDVIVAQDMAIEVYEEGINVFVYGE
jgi:hypothetical protein